VSKNHLFKNGNLPGPTVDIGWPIIARCTPREGGVCGVAEWLREEVLGVSSIHVTADTISFNLDGKRYCYRTPAKLYQWIATLDEYGKDYVRPIKCRLVANTATVRPVLSKGPLPAARKPKPPRAKATVRSCKRRFHGVRQIIADKD
jgi:hypothetical protein